jgi:hypothetical protein
VSARITVLLTFIFFCCGIFGILHHELWLDEAHHFLLARDSNSIAELAYNARYEGHPLLWNIILFVITRFTHNPLWMQVTNVLLMTCAVFIFLRRAPMKPMVKIMIVFSYYFLFEYTVISRNYALGILLMVAACALLYSPKKNYFALFTVLFLLASTHLFSLVIAVALALIAVHDYKRSNETKMKRNAFLLLSGVFFAGIFFLVWFVQPPPDHFLWDYNPDPYLSSKRIGKAASIFFKGLFPFPDITRYNCWNTNLFIDHSKILGLIPTVLCAIFPAVLFHKNRQALLFFYFAGAIIALFIFLSPIIAASRHFGFIFQLFIISLWTMNYFPEAPSFFGIKWGLWFEKVNARVAGAFIAVLLIIQTAGGIILFTLDACRPFSESRNVAEYIRSNRGPNDIIAVTNHTTGPPICSYLDRKLYYVENNSLRSFCLWNTKPYIISPDEVYERVGKLRMETPDSIKVLLVLSFSRGDSLVRDDRYDSVYHHAAADYRLLQQFDNGMVRSENYQLFEVSKRE